MNDLIAVLGCPLPKANADRIANDKPAEATACDLNAMALIADSLRNKLKLRRL
jgi:hypothetical protein